MRRLALPILAVILAALLAACADEGSPSRAIEAYLKAKVASDADELVKLSCAAWEANAAQDALSFKSVKAELQDMRCQAGDKDGDATLVTCQGRIAAEYDGEVRTQDLSAVTYRAVKEGGEWKMCGQQE